MFAPQFKKSVSRGNDRRFEPSYATLAPKLKAH
jgi:hypothetical protein